MGAVEKGYGGLQPFQRVEAACPASREVGPSEVCREGSRVAVGPGTARVGSKLPIAVGEDVRGTVSPD